MNMHQNMLVRSIADPAVAAVVKNASRSAVPDPCKLVEKIRREFSAQKGMFESLEILGGKERVRIYDPAGANVAIKLCGMEFADEKTVGLWLLSGAPGRFAWINGSDVGRYADFFREFEAFLSANGMEPEKYSIVPIEAYGTFEISQGGKVQKVYLVMELLEPEIRHTRIMPDIPSLRAALNELETHIIGFNAKAKFASPQLMDSLILGNTGKGNPESGKWVFALPHDYE